MQPGIVSTSPDWVNESWKSQQLLSESDYPPEKSSDDESGYISDEESAVPEEPAVRLY